MAIARKYAARGLRFAPEIGQRGMAAMLALFALCGFNSQALAATDTWSSSPSTGAWGTAGNWSDAAHTVPASGDSLVFGASAITSDTDNLMTPGTYNIAGITFNSGAPAYIINPGTVGTNGFTLTGGITNSSTSLETINDLITTTAARTITMTSGGGNITLGGNITGAGGGFTLAGTGTLTLSGSNSYTGAITTTATTILQLQANSGNTVAGISSAMANQNFTSAQLVAGSTIQLRADNAVASGGVVVFDSGAANFGANASGQHIGGTFNFDVNQVASGSNLTLQFGSSTSTWNLGTPSPTFNVTGGNGYTLQLGNFLPGQNASIVFNPTTANMIIGSIYNSTPSTGGVTKNGAGTLTMTGSSNSTGATSITGGILDYQDDPLFGTNGAITVSSGATAQVQGGITGGSLTLTLAGVGATGATGALENVSGANSYAGAVNLTAATTISSDAGTLSLTGATIGGATFGLTLAGAGNGSIANAIGTTSGTLTKNGAGAWTLSGANTYTGVTTVNAGTLDFGKETSLYNNTTSNWTASNIIVNSGAALAVQVGSSPNFTSGDIGTLLGMASSATGGFETGSSLGLDTTPGNFTYGGGIANAYSGSTLGLTKLGANTLTLTGANTYTGPTNVNAGTLGLGATGEVLNNTAVTVASGATLAATPSTGGISIGSAGGASLTLSGGSSLLLGATTAGSAETTTFNTLTLNGNLSIGGSSASAGLTFNLNGAGSDELVVTGAVSFGTDGGVITLVEPSSNTTPGGATQTYTLISAGSGLTIGGFTLGGSGIVSLGGNSYNASLSETGGTTVTLTLNEVTLTYYWVGGASASWSAPGNFATDHTGAVLQSSQLGSINNVILTADSPSGTNTASQTLDNSYTINSLTFSSAAPAINLSTGSGGNGASNMLTLDAASGFGITVGASPVTTTYGSGIGMVLQTGAAAQTVNVPVALGGSQTWEIDSPTNALTVQSAISDGGAGYSLTKTGVGTLILSGANTYSGGTFVNAGTVALGVANSLLTTGTATVEGTGTLDLAGNNQTLSALSDGGVSTGTVTSSSGTPTLTIGSGTFSGTISGGLSLTENGSSTLTLSGADTYTGATTITAGTLSLTGTLGGGSGGTAISNAGTFTEGAGGAIVGASSVTTAGTMTLSGANTYTGTTTITAGTLTIGGAGQLGSGSYAGNISNAGTFTYNSSAAQTLSGIISGAGALTDSGAGALTLSANETFTGVLTVNAAGTVILSGSNGARPSGTAGTTVVNGTLQLQANAGNTSGGTSYALSPEATAAALSLNNGSTVQLLSDSSVTFAGANNLGGIGSSTITFNVNQLTSTGSNDTLTFAPSGFNIYRTTINVTGGNGDTLALGELSDENSSTAHPDIFNATTGNLSINGITEATTSGVALAELEGTSTASSVGAITSGSGTVSVTKLGTGTWTLTGANTYTGATTVSGGKLIVSGGLTGSVATVAAAGVLEVDGSVAHSPVLNGGILQGIGTVPVFSTTSGDDSTVAPGLTVGSTAAGQLTASGNVTLNTGDTFSLRLGVAASTDSDSLNIGANTLTLNNATLALNVGSLVSSATPDQLYDIVVGTSGDNTAGEFDFDGSPLATGASFTTNGYTFEIFYNVSGSNVGTAGNEDVLELVSVPEPGTWALVLGGLGILVTWQRRTRRLRSSELNRITAPI